MRLRCPSCDWSGEALLDQGQMERLDEQLDDGFASLAAALAQVERFTAALAAEAILPEDF